MRILVWAIVGTVVSGAGLVSCSTVFGCHNPTGYCGDNVPDPNRVGGPSWFLSTTPDKRVAYHRDRCLSRDASLTPSEATACARRSIAEDAHHYCVLYYLPPIRPKDEAEAAERERNFSICKNDIRAQHDL